MSRTLRRIKVPPDGCWQVSLRIWWGLFWQDGSPAKHQRPVLMPDEWTPVPADEMADEASIGG